MPVLPSASSAAKLLPLTQRLKSISSQLVDSTNVVDPKLCDDIIQRLAPSLKPYIGCSIIDIKPGPALWSSKLHEYLQPRSHVLVEPESAYHAPFLQPLVDAPGSRYSLRPWRTSECFDIQRYIRDGLIPDHQGFSCAGKDSNQPNDSVLVLNNVTRMKRRGAASNISTFAAMTYASSARRMDGLHAQGQVRMLMWMPDEEKQAILPQTVSHRTRLSLLLELDFHVEEIVIGSGQTLQRRETFLDIESGKRVLERMEAVGIKIPEERQDEIQRIVQEAVAKAPDESSVTTDEAPRDWERELKRLEEAFANKEFEQFDGWLELEAKRKSGQPARRHILTPEFKRLRELRNIQEFYKRKGSRLKDALDEEAEIDALDCKIFHDEMSPQDKKAAVLRRGELSASLKERLHNQATPFQTQFAFLGDDRRALALQPPLLMWDRREAEPLVARENEFLTPKKACLVDFRPITPKPYPMTQEQAVYYDYILKGLLYYRSQTPKHLSHLAPGAFEALVPLVPSLTDPMKGGRVNLDDLRTRCLTPEMVHGLTLAWEQWPFRPDLVDLIEDKTERERFLTPKKGSALGRKSPE